MTDSTRDLHPLEQQLLSYLAEHGATVDTLIIRNSDLPDEGSFRRASQWLLSRELVCEVSREETTTLELGPVGQVFLERGKTPELALLQAIESGSSSLPEIQSDTTFEKSQWGSALGALSRTGAISGASGELRIESREACSVFERIWETVYQPASREERIDFTCLPPDVAELVRSRSPKRGRSRAEFILIEKTSQVLDITEEGLAVLKASLQTRTIGSLTPDILADGSWREARFRRYQVDIPPSRIHTGRLHPYRQFLDTVRREFVAMGFSEMRGSLAESEFWNNDALFMPQFHPARDIHDAYYLGEDSRVEPPPASLMDRVADVHENGGDTGGRGWEYSFSTEQALSVILRSQGTALSARCLAEDPDIPGKYFGITRCFRYDQVDSTHLPDFFQIEGIMLGEKINFRHLLGLLRLFASEISGTEEYKFLPAYFPFTEPSVEMHVRHPVLGWIELGGAGLFREEVCRPFGIDVPVIAWGLGLDRMAMMALGLDDIRDLVTADLSRLRRMTVRPDRLLSGSGLTEGR